MTDAQPRICFVMPYFGSWPFWLPLFLESCRTNATIDWLFFTDCEIPADYPANVQFVSTTFSDYCSRVSSALGIRFQPDKPYKLCDIRSAFGLIHSEELAAYDFWAFGDIDLIYGDLRSYFTGARLARKDLIATHSRRISGHCCLIRNNQTMREAFRKMPDWKKLFSDPRHHAVDEGMFSKLFLRHKNWPAWLARLAASAHPLRRRAEFIEAYSTPHTRVAWTNGTKRFPEHWYWNNGRLTNDIDGPREFPYFHFLVWKRAWSRQIPQEQSALYRLAREGHWQVTADGFFPLDMNPESLNG
ncbi:MAG: DUF6625 family protein [Propionivibrio sp.]